MRCAHARFDRSKRVPNRFTARAQGVRVFIQPPLHVFKDMFVFPPRNPALNAACTPLFDRAGLAHFGPIAPERQALFLVGVVILQPLVGGANINIFISPVIEVGFDEASLLLIVSCLGFWQGYLGIGLSVFHNLG